jgi:hypothetical protein
VSSIRPDAGVGCAYGMNRFGFYNPIDPRELAVRAAFYEVIGERPQTACERCPTSHRRVHVPEPRPCSAIHLASGVGSSAGRPPQS